MSKTVKIGAIVYEIVDVENLSDHGEKLDGHITYDDSCIRLEKGMETQARRATLWHEILHAILIQAGYSKHAEGQVEALSFGIMEVLENNSWLAKSPSGDKNKSRDASG